ncbi:hypothetical protein BpHYR1_044037 [Brachionus plicatilis]|uniref:Uncharacterized protein n=1 Tax=Brachionus plicatilis TaxID=10195 RepID=A0A3M7S0A6_BRAPC|nr:hypothetical protein BpHYR1_044037 [Brachionus plicatilis]
MKSKKLDDDIIPLVVDCDNYVFKYCEYFKFFLIVWQTSNKKKAILIICLVYRIYQRNKRENKKISEFVYLIRGQGLNIKSHGTKYKKSKKWKKKIL